MRRMSCDRMSKDRTSEYPMEIVGGYLYLLATIYKLAIRLETCVSTVCHFQTIASPLNTCRDSYLDQE